MYNPTWFSTPAPPENSVSSHSLWFLLNFSVNTEPLPLGYLCVYRTNNNPVFITFGYAFSCDHAECAEAVAHAWRVTMP